jgi:hypothetical protein
MPTVADVLRGSGFTEEQIAALDNRTITAFSGVLSAAEQERQRAEAERQANATFYDQQISPSLAAWDEQQTQVNNEKARLAAEVAFYRTQAEQARASGFIPSDAPGFEQPRDQGGRYVAGAPGGTPGSPTFFDVNQVYQRAGDAVSVLTDIQWEHQKLFGQPLPISPGELVKQADRVKLDPRTYAARTFNWDARKAEMEKKQQEEHDNQIRKEAEAARDKVWSEKVGSNPDVRMPMASRYADTQKAVKQGLLPDPLTLNESQRRTATAQAIRHEISERQD